MAPKTCTEEFGWEEVVRHSPYNSSFHRISLPFTQFVSATLFSCEEILFLFDGAKYYRKEYFKSNGTSFYS